MRLLRPWDFPGKSHLDHLNQQQVKTLGKNSITSVKVTSLSHVRLFATPWPVAHQAPPSLGFSRQEYWSGLPIPSPGDLPDPGIEPRSPALQADALISEPPEKPYYICESVKKTTGLLLPKCSGVIGI